MKTIILTTIAVVLYSCSLWLVSISDAELREYKTKVQNITYQLIGENDDD